MADRIQEQGVAGSLRAAGSYPSGDRHAPGRSSTDAHVVAVLADGRALIFGDALADPAGRRPDEVLRERIDRIGRGLNTEPVAWSPPLLGWTTPGMPPECASRRTNHTMTALPDNKVLVAGGWCDRPRMRDDTTPLPTFTGLSLWNAATGRWEAVAASLSAERILHTASLLADGSVMLVGGATGLHPSAPGLHIVADVERYRDGKVAGLPPLRVARARHTASPLPDGSLLIAGGSGSDGKPLDSVEIWNPSRQEWHGAAPLAHKRHSHTATVLNDGRVLVAGGVGEAGQPLASVEIWDPRTQAWHAGEPLPYPLHKHAAARLAGGDILVAGGHWTREEAPGRVILWERASERWRPAGTLEPNVEDKRDPSLTVAPRPDGSAHIFTRNKLLHWMPQATRDTPYPPHGERDLFATAVLPDGRVLIAGGRLSNLYSRLQRPPISDVAELFDPVSARFAVTGRMRQPRIAHSLLPLPDGRVLAAGGWVWHRDGGETPLANHPELWNPATGSWTLIEGIRFEPHESVHFGKLADGRILFVASNETPVADPAGQPPYRAWLWNPGNGRLETKPVRLTPRSTATMTILPDGRVLRVGGRIRSFVSGECGTPLHPGGDAGSCAGQGPRWSDRPDPGAELWDSRSGETTRLASPPDWDATDGKSLVTRNGDALLVAHQPVRFGRVARLPKAAVLSWNARDGWRRLPHLPSDENWPMLELADGTLWTPWHRLPPGAAAWQDSPTPIQESPAFVQLPDKGPLALSMLPPHAAFLGSTADRWVAALPQRASPVLLAKPAIVELADGQVLVIGKVEERQDAMASAFIWNPKADNWRQAAAPLHPWGKAAQAIRLPSGHVLHTSIGRNDNLQCELWKQSEDRWERCDSDLMTGAFATAPGLGLLDDGRAIVVADTVTGYAFDETSMRWTAMSGEWNGENLTQGVAVRPDKPLQRLLDEPSGTWLDTSAAAGRYWERSGSGGRLSPSYNSRSARIAEPAIAAPRLLWDSAKRQWSYVFRFSDMGREASALPDGCAFSWRPPTLFDPATGKVSGLHDPGIGVTAVDGAMAVLADGTAVIMGKADGMGSGFFRRKVSCAGFAAAEEDDALRPPRLASETVARAAAAGARPAGDWRDSMAELWKKYRWLMLAAAGPALLYLLLRKVILPPLKRGAAALLPPRIVAALKRPLPRAYARDTRIVIYGLVLVLATPTLLAVVGLKFTENDRACQEAARGCLDPETGLLRSVPKLERRTLFFFGGEKPEIPCRFVGTWNARHGATVYVVTLKDDGRFTMTDPTGAIRRDRSRAGYWMAQGGHLVWRPDSGYVENLDINVIVRESAQEFELVEQDGSHSTFERIKAGESATCKR